jgi:putative ATP-dependent endonuclease of OLD family
VTDNDKKLDKLEKKYKNYLNENKKDYIGIFYGETEENYTLEPCIVNAHERNIELLNKIFYSNENNKTKEELISYMTNKDNKTKCALKIFDTDEKITFPKYILEAINHAKNAK